MANLITYQKYRAFDNNGDPLSGGKVYTYESGTTTPKVTWWDSGETEDNTNPVILDSRGEANIWLNGSYTIVLKDSNDVLIDSQDDITGIGSLSDLLDQWVQFDVTPIYVSATRFTLSGNQTSEFEAGRRIKTTNTSGTVYSTILSSSYSDPLTTVVTANDDSASFDSGLSYVSLSILSVTNQAYPYREFILPQTITHDIVTDANYTLTATQNLYGRIIITDTEGTLTDSVNIIVSDAIRGFNLSNQTGYDLFVKTSEGTGVPIGYYSSDDLYCDGTNVIPKFVKQGIRSDGILAPHDTLNITNYVSSPNTQIEVSALEITLTDISTNYGHQITFSEVDVIIDITASGANGLDTGSEAVSTWYHIWIIYNPITGDIAGILSESPYIPTFPSGYVYYAYVGAIYNDIAGNFLTMEQNNNIASIESTRDLTTGSAGTSTAVTLTIPSTAIKARGHYSGSNSSGITSLLYLSPNNATTGIGIAKFGGTIAGATALTLYGQWESHITTASTIYYAMTGSSVDIYTTGWEF